MTRKRNDRASRTRVPLSSLADEVRTRRQKLELTQGELADVARCSTRFVREVEGGKGTVRLDKLVSLLKALGFELRIVPRQAS